VALTSLLLPLYLPFRHLDRIVKLALVESLKHHLHMAKELFWSSLVEDGDSEVHVVGDLDLEGVVLTLDNFLFRDVFGVF
jgi:hypothetical protein